MAIDPKRVKEIFLEAADLSDEAARAAYLDNACGGEAGLRDRVEALLRSHDPEGSFLGTPAAVVPDPDHAATRAYPPTPDGAAARTRDGGASADDEPLTFLAPPTRPDALGRIGHYEVLQVLGRGGFGIVFRAFDDVLQRVVAVKVLAPEIAATSPARKRFLREARSSAAVRHENVVQVYEVGEQPLPYLVMEFIPGETLQQRLDGVGPVEPAEVVRVGRQIAEGLAAAHATDLVHRDIKPGNILLESGQQKVKLTDFGLARTADDASISQSGIIAGTPMYMAPEQAHGHRLDQRADLFSLGSVLYQMVAGRPPFRANSTLAVLKRVAEDTPRDLREIIPETPPWLCAIIAKLHAKNPDDRFQSAREVADLLADCEAQLKADSKLKDLSRIPRGKSSSLGIRKWVAAAAVLLLPVLALTVTDLAGVTHLFRGQQAMREPTRSGDERAPIRGVKEDELPHRDGWVQLFNGKDLTGWKTHPNQPDGWAVKGDVLVGTGALSHLFTERGDFADFDLRIEARINDRGDSGVFFRCEYGLSRFRHQRTKREPDGYEVQILYAGWADAWKTGSIIGPDERAALRTMTANVIRPDDWFTLEVTARGNRIAVKVDGKPIANYTDAAKHYPRGHIALQLNHPATVVQFRKIEIQELPPGAAGLALDGRSAFVAAEDQGRPLHPEQAKEVFPRS